MSDQIIEIDEDGKVTIPMKDCCRAAVQAEREACAKLAQTTPFRTHHKDDIDFHSGCEQTRDRIVAAIRARTGQEEGEKCQSS